MLGGVKLWELKEINSLKMATNFKENASRRLVRLQDAFNIGINMAAAVCVDVSLKQLTFSDILNLALFNWTDRVSSHHDNLLTEKVSDQCRRSAPRARGSEPSHKALV